MTIEPLTAVRTTDPRLRPPRWDPVRDAEAARRKLLFLLPVNAVVAVWYFGWLLWPGRIGNPVLYGLLLVAECLNLVQASGFWWTCLRGATASPPIGPPPLGVEVDVLIPVYDEPLEVVAPTVAAACAQRSVKAHALVAVLDCDHVPARNFLEVTVADLTDDSVAFVQTPQYYANARNGPVPAAAWSQQALFFGAIARGKAAMGAMFCCGTNVVFRRAALRSVGGFPEGSLTEDFALSLRLHERNWRSVYRPTVLASGLGPEDMASYVSQQHRWARGCLAALPAIITARNLKPRVRLQYLLASLFFLSGWTFLLYMALPIARIATGAQPVAGATADQFLLHFMPYFAACLAAVAVAGAGTYTFAAFALLFSSFWVHVAATVQAILSRRGRFVVTAKQGSARRQPRAVLPAIGAIGALALASAGGLASGASPATVNNVAFAGLHVFVLLVGIRPALAAGRPSSLPRPAAAPQQQPAPAVAMRDHAAGAANLTRSGSHDVNGSSQRSAG